MQWTGISIAAPSAETEDAVVALLLSAGCAGVALDGEGHSRKVTSYLPDTEGATQRLKQIVAALSILPSIGIVDAGAPLITKVDEEDWANSWKAYFKPIRLGRRLVITPPWEAPDLAETDLAIVIDPGMAFGTGTHATTQMCLEMLEDYILPGSRVADIGTGSGILSIAASKLGAGSVVAVDNDPLAVKIAAENAEVNGTLVEVADSPLVTGAFDLVVANIIADTLIAMADDFACITVPEGVLIVSGVIDGRADEVRLFIEAAGFRSLESHHKGEWTALAFRRISD